MRDPTKYCVLLSFLILFLSSQTYSQNYIPDNKAQFKHLTYENGLLGSYIYCFMQDSKGFMWISTVDGLHRYDGRKFKVFRHSSDDVNSIGANNSFALYEDKAGNIWIGTSGGGLNKYDPKSEKFTRYFHRLKDTTRIIIDTFTAIHEDKKGTFWIGTWGGGLNKFDPESEQFTNYIYDPDDPASLSNNIVQSIFEDSKGNLWIGTIEGINKFDRTDNKFYRFVHDPNNINSLSHNNVTVILEDKSGGLWVATMGGGLNKLIYNNDSVTFLHYKHNANNRFTLSDNNISSMFIDEENIMWVGHYGGGLSRTLSALSNNSIPLFINYKNDPFDYQSLNENVVTSVYKDNNGLVWVGTRSEGVNILNTKKKAFGHYKHEPGNPYSLSANGVCAVYEDRSGTLWIGTRGGGLNKMDRATNRFTHYKNNPNDPSSLSNNTARVIYEDNSLNLWVGTWNGGLNKFNREKNKFFHYKNEPLNPNSISDNVILSLTEDHLGNLWIGTSYGGLNKLDKENNSFSTINFCVANPEELNDDHIHWLYKDKSDVIWIAVGSSGLVSYDYQSDNFQHYKNDPDDVGSISNEKVTAVFEDKSGVLWLGTMEGGLNKFNKEKGKFNHYSTKDGLPTDYIQGILEDDSGNLWISTNNGLSKFNPQTETFRNYDIEDGLQSNQFDQSCCWKSSTGELIFGGINGFNIFYPDSIKDNTHIPPVFITDFHLFNKPVPVGYDSLNKRTILSRSIIECEEIELKFDDNVFSFEFAALDFHAPNKNKYAYIMEGFDREWTYTDVNRATATYTNLDPGEYTFKVKGSNNDGYWNETGASIKILITPPWWKTSWAYLFYFLLIGSIIYLTWKAQLKRIRIKNEYEMSRFETKKLQEVDEIKSRFFTNISHEFRTPLTLILGPVKQMIEKLNEGKMKDDLSLVHRNANKLLELVNQLLDISKLESGNMKLQASPRNIIPLLKALVLSFTSYAERKRITLKFYSDKDEIVVYFDKDKIEKIITNILSNAFKFTPDGGRIEVAVSCHPEFISGSLSSSAYSLNRKIPDLVQIPRQDWDYQSKFVKIFICDTGAGIPKDKLDKIFDRFYQVDSSHTREQEGTGIGLSLTKELVELHKGIILVESEEGKGTTVTVSIPLGKEHLKPEEIYEADEEKAAEGEPRQRREYEKEKDEKIFDYEGDETKAKEVEAETKFFEKESLPLLLIVEDNSDVRYYIKDNLKKEYRILEAVDGEDGWNKSVEQIPDLIISDIMMPVMDGFQLCEKLKTDERTSHIPVILLTAKAAKEDKIEGYETGADEYLMKPFEPDELRARIKNLIGQRKRLHKYFQSKGIFDLSQQKITSVDKKFLQKVFDVIMSRISDSSFNVEFLADELLVSRSVLHRKILSLTGETPGELIRRIRLNKAAELIKQGFGNLSEIALEVGFNNPAYFSEAFKKQFGIAPSQYQRNNKTS